MKPFFGITALMLPIALGGCASSMSGLGGSESLSCKAPAGVQCKSVSGVYANAASIATRSAPVTAAATSVAPTTLTYGANSIVPSQDKQSGTHAKAARSQPRVLRLWFAPWEDSDGDLHEEAVVHMLIDNGRWLIDHVRAAPRSRMDGVAPPLATIDSTAAKGASELSNPTERLPLAPGSGPVLSIPMTR